MQRLRAIIVCVALTLLPARAVLAQVIGSDNPQVPLTGIDTRAAAIIPGAPPALMQFTVDPASGGGDFFDVVSSHPQAVVSLILPGGAEINSANAAAQGFSFDVVTISEDDLGLASNFDLPGTHTVIGLPASSPSGTYQVKIDGSAVTTTEAVIATYYSASPVSAGVVTDAGTYRAGDTVVVSAILLDGVAPIAGATVNASVGDPSQAGAVPTQVVLQDSGQYDEAPGDGIYTGTFTANQAGQFTVQMRATGTSAAGASFSRTASTSFRVLPPLARLLSFSDAGVDDNGNNLIDRIVVTATVDVQAAGNYLFTLGLVSSSGVRINASTSSPLATGTQQISVSFPAADVASLGADGPYQRRDATLSAADDAERTVTSFVGDAGLTAAYLRSSLERPAIQFTGTNTAAGIDTNGNGKFDILSIQAEVNVISAGSYHWNGGLRDTSGKTIQLVSNSASLTAGLNTVTFNFDGKKIAQNDKDGPFSLTSVMMYSPDASTVINELWKTPAFAVGDFECSGVIPPPIQSATLTPTSVIGGNSSRLRVNFTEPAGACGAKISLSSDRPAAIAAVIPTDVVVAAGQSFAEVTVITSGVAAPTAVVLTVTSGATSQSVTLNVTPAALATLTVTPATAAAGAGVTGKVTLDGAAPPAGSVVALASSDPVNASVPASVTIPGGTREATFIINTNAALEGTASATISASYAGATKSAPLTVYGEVFIDGAITPGGPPVAVNAAQPGQNFRLAFEGAAGQRVSVRITDVTIGNSCCGSHVSVKNPDGTYLMQPTWAGTSGLFIEPLTLPAAGTYTFVIDPVGSNTGSMTVRMWDVPPDFAANITPGGPAVTATTTAPGQNARVTFGGAAGQRVSLSVSGVTVSYSYVSILKPDGTPMFNPVYMGTNGTFIDTVTLPAAGAYTILIDPTVYHTGLVTLTLYDVPPDVTGTISAGGPSVTVTTIAPGQRGLLTFGGTEGQRVSLKISGVTLTGGNGYADVFLKKPDGTNLASATYVSSSGSFIDTQALPASGTYTIVVAPQETNTGSVTLTLYNVPADATASMTLATPVTVSVGVPGQNAVVSFNGAANQRVTVNIGVSLTGGNGYADFYLRKPDGTTLGSATYVSSGGGFINVQTLPVAGVYTVYFNPQGSTTGSATLTLNDVSADVTGSAAVGGSSTTVTTNSAGQNARLTFEGTAGQRVSINSTSTFGGCWYLGVYKPNGSQLSNTLTCGSSLFVEPVTLPVTGTYTLLIDPTAAQIGSATVTLYGVVDVTGSVTVGGASVSTTVGTPGQVSRLSFEGAAGQRVSVSGSSNFNGNGCWYLGIFKADGSQLSNTLNCGANTFLDPLTLPAAGTYNVTVNPSGAVTGTATITVFEVVDATGSAEVGGSSVSTTVGTPGAVARISFEGTAGQRVSVYGSSTFNGCWYLGVYKPDGSQLTNVFNCSSATFVEPATLPVSGTYTLVVDPSGTLTGSATVRLYNVVDQTGQITVGGGGVSTNIATPGQVTRLTFEGTAGRRVSVNSSANFTACWYLGVYKPDGSQLSNTFSCGSTFVEPQTLPVSGTYTVLVDPSSSGTGTATVSLYEVTDATGMLDVNGSALNVNLQVPGQNAALTFGGSAGQQATVRATGSTIGCVRVTLYKPDNTSMTNTFSCGGNFNLTTQTLPVAGTYKITVDPSNSNTGSISVSVTSP